jgi:signal transduction histidine kinase
MNGMKAQFQKKNIDFRMLTSEKIQVKTDRYRFGQSIYNILINAYKFTPSEGTVTLNYYLENDNIKIEITDTGCGIREEEQERIFDAYYKNSTDTGEAGDGIGLYVAKENMESLHGHIEVQSKEGKGSKFILRFPAE